MTNESVSMKESIEPNLSIDIESSVAHTHDPYKFWNCIKRLGSERKNKFPDECFKNGEIHTDPETMEEVWSTDFKR